MPSSPVWQVLDVGSIWMKEFASSMSAMAPTVAWEASISKFGFLRDREVSETIANPPLEITHFPLQAGHARRPLRWIFPYQKRLLNRLLARCSAPQATPLICSTPFYAPVAERWPGPVAYYSTDLTCAYDDLDPAQVNCLDRRLCRVAAAVFPNSRRIAEYFVERAGCDAAKITVVPNATRQSNISPHPLLQPEPLPLAISHVPRPIAGVLGNLAGNMDWLLIAEAVRLTPQIHWVFVGPATMPIQDAQQAAAREWVRKNATFTGCKPYGELQNFARAFDVAVLPYKKKEPTYSGSSTRFYEHLAACRPMIATRGFAELLEKPPLVTLVDTAAELRDVLEQLKGCDFHDGLEQARWKASQCGTWENRAETILRSPLLCRCLSAA
jgi:glycosyltransferase involved in cell wall biosynthesis